MAVNWVLPVRGVQAVLSIVVLGLMSYVASWWSSHWRQMSPHEVNFIVFSSVWSILSLGALLVLPWKLPRVAESGLVRVLLVGVEGLATLFWLSSFIALAVFLSDRICFGTVCSVAKAGTALSAFEFVVWAVTAVVAVLNLVRGGRGVGSGSGKGEPKVEMHQGV
ncbi:hypothetical protein K491DRAFT_589724 [Lophiostoma macrostomum CBS 122681]|uniref:MARVEL domain-containing protein n=1 Tax=Lophiostoma macrostomum CBS 122681 TaxID=1314788 RepID=A0A6A6TL83_9PLEO|nr:hypothetical protein K491DRAFT_589724 [Lophiostoma macrostomum CBS 122681]